MTTITAIRRFLRPVARSVSRVTLGAVRMMLFPVMVLLCLLLAGLDGVVGLFGKDKR